MSGTGGQGPQAQPTFTIEQIELIRRLRNSGLTKEQVVQAFDSFERVDAELGNLYTVPISLSQQKSFTAAGTQIRPVGNTNSPQPPQPATAQPPSPKPSCTTSQSHTNGQSQSSDGLNTRPHSVAPLLVGNRRRSGRVKRRRSEEEEKTAGTDVIRLSMKDFAMNATLVNLFPGQVSPEDVDEFLKKDPEEMQAEIRDFLFTQPSIVHNDIATAAGVALSCVSKFLVGNFSALPSDVLRQLSQWFLTARPMKKQPQQRTQPRPILPRPPPPQQQQPHCNLQTSKLLPDVILERLNCSVPATTAGPSGSTGQHPTGKEASAEEPDHKMDTKPIDSLPGTPGTPGVGEGDAHTVNFTPRRERFTFRKKHLEVLEMHFKTNQYPTYEERTDIAQRCNDIMEVVSGRRLYEKEKMTPQNVAYWFSNHRKDIKRMAREGGIEMSEVVLPSKVKQSPSPVSILDSETAGSYWATDSHSTGYSPLEIPSVGPVAFPTMVHRSFSETNVSADVASVSPDSQGDALLVKQEPQESKSVSGVTVKDSNSGAITNGHGSTVDRIAAEISSQLASKAEGASTDSRSDIKSEKSAAESHGESSVVLVKCECVDSEPESR